MFSFLTLHTTVGVIMNGYGIAIMAMPHYVVTGYVIEAFSISRVFLAAAFIVCGVFIILAKPKPGVFSIAITPILLYAISAVVYVLNRGGEWTNVVGHFAVWLLISVFLYEKAKEWTP